MDFQRFRISDINNSVNTWCNEFSKIADKHAPIKTRRVKSTSKSPWITPELTELLRDRDYHKKQTHKTNSEYHWQHFRQLRNHVNSQIKLAKSKYFQDLVNTNKDKPSELLKTLNELTSRKKSETGPSCIISEDKTITDQKSIASILNEYFTSIGTKLADTIKSIFQCKQYPPSTSLPFSFEFEEVDETLVRQELSFLKTNKATELDQFSAKLLKDSCSFYHCL